MTPIRAFTSNSIDSPDGNVNASPFSFAGDDVRPRGVVKRRLVRAYRRAKVKLKGTSSDADSVAPDSSSESEASVM